MRESDLRAPPGTSPIYPAWLEDGQRYWRLLVSAAYARAVEDPVAAAISVESSEQDGGRLRCVPVFHYA